MGKQTPIITSVNDEKTQDSLWVFESSLLRGGDTIEPWTGPLCKKGAGFLKIMDTPPYPLLVARKDSGALR